MIEEDFKASKEIIKEELEAQKKELLSEGVIADFQVTEKMLQHFIAKVHEQRFIKPSPRVLVCVPCRSTQVERRAIRESVFS